jgi:hypothetical protein
MRPTRLFPSVSIRSYFRSGWAFLIPYLAAYLLFAWLKWPVHPVDDGPWTPIPSLLHVYWFLHAIHLVLGALALRTWWRSATAGTLSGQTEKGGPPRIPDSKFAALYDAAPWVGLAALFYIPGVYFEWPADPWHHLQRIDWWSDMDYVTAHSSWLKSSYFIPYSLLSWATEQQMIFWMDFYYTGISLLLSWQYFLLARACGLGRRTSTVFVLLQALLFGNNIFSFYRYYGISSSIYAQICAVALTRIALETVRGCVHQGHEARGAQNRSEGEAAKPIESRFPTPFTLLIPGASALMLLTLIALNHVQGLGIAGLGVGAAMVWGLIQWRRSLVIGFVGVAAFLSVATVLWYPRDANIAAIYQAQGWLNAWYGFNLFDPHSIAFDRSMHILGAFGLLNLAAAVWLIRRNHIVGWLTLMPVVALALPCVALPFAQFIATTTHTSYILTFHRMLFAIPSGLALVATLSKMVGPACSHYPLESLSPVLGDPRPPGDAMQVAAALPRGFAFLMIPMALGAALIAPPHAPNSINLFGYNRSWNALAIVPADLRRSSAEGQTSAMSQAAYLSQHWASHRNIPTVSKGP